MLRKLVRRWLAAQVDSRARWTECRGGLPAELAKSIGEQMDELASLRRRSTDVR